MFAIMAVGMLSAANNEYLIKMGRNNRGLVISHGRKSGYWVIPVLVGGSSGLSVIQIFPFFCSAILKISKNIGQAFPCGHKMAATVPGILSIQNTIPRRKEESSNTNGLPLPGLPLVREDISS